MSGISLRNEKEEEHSVGSVRSDALCWERHPRQVAYARRQTFHVDLSGVEYNKTLCVRKSGRVVRIVYRGVQPGYSDPPLTTDRNLATIDEVFAINPGGDTVPDYDYFRASNACKVLAVGAFRLTLVAARLKDDVPSKEYVGGKGGHLKPGDNPRFGANNDPRSEAGGSDPDKTPGEGNYVQYRHIDISDAMGGKSGSYVFVYAPGHCGGVTSGISGVPWLRRLIASVAVGVLCGVNPADDRWARELLDELADPHRRDGPSGVTGLRPVTAHGHRSGLPAASSRQPLSPAPAAGGSAPGNAGSVVADAGRRPGDQVEFGSGTCHGGVGECPGWRGGGEQ